MADIEKIRELLGSGCSNDIVATAVGCTPSYISQLMSDQDFAASVTNLRAAALTANTKRDRAIDGIEDTLVESLKDYIDAGVFTKPRDILSAFNIVNKAVRRGVSSATNLQVNNTIVNLSLPTVVINKFVLNASSEVIEIDGQTMVSKPAAQLLKDLTSGDGADGDSNGKYKEIAKYIPASGNSTNELTELNDLSGAGSVIIEQLSQPAEKRITTEDL